MAIICPTITANTESEYDRQLEVLSSFTSRIHIDVMDGIFTSSKSPSLEYIHWPSNIQADLHLMLKNPDEYLNKIIELKPNMVLIHAECSINHLKFAAIMHENSIKCGLVLLQETTVKSVDHLLYGFDQILIFSGHLGYQGGRANTDYLYKVKEIHDIYPEYEIAWDGGINEHNVQELINGGVEILNVGNAVIGQADPENAYKKLMLKLN